MVAVSKKKKTLMYGGSGYGGPPKVRQKGYSGDPPPKVPSGYTSSGPPKVVYSPTSQLDSTGNSLKMRAAVKTGRGAKSLAKGVGIGVGAVALGLPAGAASFGLTLATGAVAAGLTAVKSVGRLASAGVSAAYARRAKSTLKGKLGGLDEIGISNKLSSYESRKKNLNSRHLYSITRLTQALRQGKNVSQEISKADSKYQSALEALATQIEQKHSTKKLSGDGTTVFGRITAEEAQKQATDPSFVPLTLSQKLDLALQHSKSNLANRYENAKAAYETKRQTAINNKKKELGFSQVEQEFKKSKSDFNNSQRDFLAKQEKLDQFILDNPTNWAQKPEIQQIRSDVEASGKKYRDKLSQFQWKSSTFKNKEKELAKSLKSTRSLLGLGFKRHDGYNKGIDFYEGKAQGWKNSYKRTMHNLKQDWVDVDRIATKIGSFGFAKVSKRSDYDGTKSQYNTMSRSDINPFGFRPFTSKLEKIKNMQKLFETGKTDLTGLDKAIKDIQIKMYDKDINNSTNINAFLQNANKNESPGQSATRKIITRLNERLNKLDKKDPNYVYKQTELNYFLKTNMTDYYTMQMNSLNLDKSRRKKLLTIAELTTKDLISEPDYFKNINKLHANPDYNGLLTKLIAPNATTFDKLASLNDEKNRLISLSRGAKNLEGRAKANDELQIIKKLIRHNKGIELQEQITNEMKSSQQIVTNSIKERAKPKFQTPELKQNYINEIDSIRKELIADKSDYNHQKKVFTDIESKYTGLQDQLAVQLKDKAVIEETKANILRGKEKNAKKTIENLEKIKANENELIILDLEINKIKFQDPNSIKIKALDAKFNRLLETGNILHTEKKKLKDTASRIENFISENEKDMALFNEQFNKLNLNAQIERLQPQFDSEKEIMNAKKTKVETHFDNLKQKTEEYQAYLKLPEKVNINPSPTPSPSPSPSPRNQSDYQNTL